jgi:hypothetical protein
MLPALWETSCGVPFIVCRVRNLQRLSSDSGLKPITLALPNSVQELANAGGRSSRWRGATSFVTHGQPRRTCATSNLHIAQASETHRNNRCDGSLLGGLRFHYGRGRTGGLRVPKNPVLAA